MGNLWTHPSTEPSGACRRRSNSPMLPWSPPNGLLPSPTSSASWRSSPSRSDFLLLAKPASASLPSVVVHLWSFCEAARWPLQYGLLPEGSDSSAAQVCKLDLRCVLRPGKPGVVRLCRGPGPLMRQDPPQSKALPYLVSETPPIQSARGPAQEAAQAVHG